MNNSLFVLANPEILEEGTLENALVQLHASVQIYTEKAQDEREFNGFSMHSGCGIKTGV